MRRLRGWGSALAAGLLVATGTGCGGDIAPVGAPEVEPGAPQTSTPVADPPGQGPDPDGVGDTGDVVPEPDDPVEESPSLTLPALPIGGSPSESFDPARPENQCVAVNWSAQEGSPESLGSGVAVTVTGVEFHPKKVFTVAESGCDDTRPSCVGFVFTEDSQLCNLAVAPTGADPGVESPVVSLTGTVDCAAIGTQACNDFAQAAAGSGNHTIDLLVPDLGSPDDTTDDGPTDPGDTTDDTTGDGASQDDPSGDPAGQPPSGRSTGDDHGPTATPGTGQSGAPGHGGSDDG